eukprot:TRINITY_DN3267_c0_g1_i2.p1 TRINITY_DN3267_c0_g1~~TRINITY_DN3267_c0_g1_i2.p1  ORF type:complete len:400 (-),score=78.92 TRINITY_DN3267_c0_g1_i2:115-1314(-)
MFAKPFVGALSGHADGVFCMSANPKRLSEWLSGSCDGEVKIWNLPTRKVLRSIPAHRGFVRGIAIPSNSRTFFTCGEDRTVKQWAMDLDDSHEDKDYDGKVEPLATFLGSNPFTAIDHQRLTSTFATAGDVIEIWNHNRSEPINKLSWGCDAMRCVKFNPVEIHLVASTGSDRGIGLYDLRSRTPVRKMVMEMSSNALAWNPMEAFNFTVANEDHNCYTFDMRKLEVAQNVHTDHVSAVMDISYSPTGEEFVTGSYDRTVRIFPRSAGHSREVYHTKRMQRLFSVRFTADARYVLSGSDDTNVRIWKAVADDSIKVSLPRESQKKAYDKKLIERYQNAPEIKRIKRHRHLPKSIYLAKKKKTVMRGAELRKLKNVRNHSKPGSVKVKPERKKHIVKEFE